jgi:heme-degrading monooxygenase HmoA
MYTSGVWLVKAGREDEFARLWQASADNLSLEFPDITFRLLRSTEEPRRFVSVGGPWRGAEQIAAARDLPSFQAAMKGVEKILESGSLETYELVAEVS